MNHVTVLRVGYHNKPGFRYYTFGNAVRFGVIGGSIPRIEIEPCGDIDGEIIELTGDLLVMNGQGDPITSISWEELIGTAPPTRRNVMEPPPKPTNALFLSAKNIISGWGEEYPEYLETLLYAMHNRGDSLGSYLVAITNHEEKNNALRAVVYLPDTENKIQQIVGVVKEDMGVFIGALGGASLEALGIGMDGSYFGHYGQTLSIYQPLILTPNEKTDPNIKVLKFFKVQSFN